MPGPSPTRFAREFRGGPSSYGWMRGVCSAAVLVTTLVNGACGPGVTENPAGPGGRDGAGDGADVGGAGPGDGQSGGADGQDDAPVVLESAPLPRLTVAQYLNAIERVFGPGLDAPELQADDRPDFYSVIGAARQPVTESGVSLLWEAAKSLAQAIVADETRRPRLLTCDTAPSVDAACIDSFLDGTGRRLFRRPLSADERTRYGGLVRAAAGDNLWRGVRFALTAMLASPAFLYRHERTVDAGDGTGLRKYDDYALASRLSFLTLNDGPDDELLALAEAGALSDPEELSRQLDRLYPRALDAGLQTFVYEYLDLDAAGTLNFEGFDDAEDAQIGRAMRGEVIALARDAMADGQDFRRLFTTRETHLSGPLAALYGIEGITGETLSPYTFPEDGVRAGLLTTGAFLTADGADDRTKPTNRGLYVQFRLMCTHIPDPPDNIPPLDATGKDPVATSVREALELHRTNPSCAACHQFVDPIGIGMEDFDQYGRFRTAYSDGSEVDATSEWNGVPFEGARALGELLGRDPKVAECMTRQLFRYATARIEGAGEARVIDALSRRFVERGYEFKELVRALVMSPSFRYAAPESEEMP